MSGPKYALLETKNTLDRHRLLGKKSVTVDSQRSEDASFNALLNFRHIVYMI